MAAPKNATAEKPASEAARQQAPEGTKTPTPSGAVPGLRVMTRRDGFRRGGRAWHGTTEIAASELTPEQIAQLRAEPLLTVVDIEIEQ